MGVQSRSGLSSDIQVLPLGSLRGAGWGEGQAGPPEASFPQFYIFFSHRVQFSFL